MYMSMCVCVCVCLCVSVSGWTNRFAQIIDQLVVRGQPETQICLRQYFAIYGW